MSDYDTEVLEKFAKVLANVENVAKTQTADTGKYSYRYADLGDVLDEVKRACSDQGLVVAQIPSFSEGLMTVTTMLIAEGGDHVAFAPCGLPMPKEAQAFGSALTYLRRYSLLTIFGIAPEDDDGRAATVAAQTTPGRRTEAERMIRETMADMGPVVRGHFIEDFKAEFGMSLSDLPASKHGAALAWARGWTAPAQEEPEEQLAGPPIGGRLPPTPEEEPAGAG